MTKSNLVFQCGLGSLCIWLDFCDTGLALAGSLMVSTTTGSTSLSLLCSHLALSGHHPTSQLPYSWYLQKQNEFCARRRMLGLACRFVQPPRVTVRMPLSFSLILLSMAECFICWPVAPPEVCAPSACTCAHSHYAGTAESANTLHMQNFPYLGLRGLVAHSLVARRIKRHVHHVQQHRGDLRLNRKVGRRASVSSIC